MERRVEKCSIKTQDGEFEAAATRFDLNTVVVESERRLRYGDQVTVRVGWIDLPAVVRWTTDRGFGVNIGSLRPMAIWGLHQMGLA